MSYSQDCFIQPLRTFASTLTLAASHFARGASSRYSMKRMPKKKKKLRNIKISVVGVFKKKDCAEWYRFSLKVFWNQNFSTISAGCIVNAVRDHFTPPGPPLNFPEAVSIGRLLFGSVNENIFYKKNFYKKEFHWRVLRNFFKKKNFQDDTYMIDYHRLLRFHPYDHMMDESLWNFSITRSKTVRSCE